MENYYSEDKNCRCDCNMNMDMDCNYTPQGINAAFGYNTASTFADGLDCTCENNTNECSENRRRVREEMMRKIKCLNFSVIDLAEYLDTHPDDKKAICLHREYTNQLKDLKDKYQRIFGPLSIYYPCNKWRWLEEPWPWFILGE